MTLKHGAYNCAVWHVKQDTLSGGSGVLFYGDSAAHGVKASSFVEDLKTRADFNRFINEQDEKVAQALQRTALSCPACLVVVWLYVTLFQPSRGV